MGAQIHLSTTLVYNKKKIVFEFVYKLVLKNLSEIKVFYLLSYYTLELHYRTLESSKLKKSDSTFRFSWIYLFLFGQVSASPQKLP